MAVLVIDYLLSSNAESLLAVVTNKKAPYSKQGAFLWDIPNLSSFNPPNWYGEFVVEKGGLGAKVAIFDLNEEAGNATAAELGADKAIFCQTDVISE